MTGKHAQLGGTPCCIGCLRAGGTGSASTDHTHAVQHCDEDGRKCGNTARCVLPVLTIGIEGNVRTYGQKGNTVHCILPIHSAAVALACTPRLAGSYLRPSAASFCWPSPSAQMQVTAPLLALPPRRLPQRPVARLCGHQQHVMPWQHSSLNQSKHNERCVGALIGHTCSRRQQGPKS